MTDEVQSQITYDRFKSLVRHAKVNYEMLAEKSPTLRVLEEVKEAENRLFMPFSDSSLDANDFKSFLGRANHLSGVDFKKSVNLLSEAIQMVVSFNKVSDKILKAIEKNSLQVYDFKEVRTLLTTERKSDTSRCYADLKVIFAYFKDYGEYLMDAVTGSEIKVIASEAKKALATTQKLADTQKKLTNASEKMLEESGRLSRGDVYYGLAFGQKIDKKKNETPWDSFKRVCFVRRGYRQTARWWLIAVVASIIITTVCAYWLFAHSELHINFSRPTFEVIALIVVKALILIPLIYLIRFVVHSYRVNKHLEVLYTHRWALHQTLPSHLALTEGDTSEVKSRQLDVVTPFFYGEIETGYISKKDGLGDKSIEIIPEGMVKILGKKK